MREMGPRVGASPSTGPREEGLAAQKFQPDSAGSSCAVCENKAKARDITYSIQTLKKEKLQATHEQSDSLFAEPLCLVGPHLSAVLKYSFRGREGKHGCVC